MLVNVTFSLPEDTLKRLRRAAKEVGGGRKGAISEIVEAAIREHLREVEATTAREEFRALQDENVVARAPSLKGLASELKRLRLDPREVLIVSSAPLEPSVRTGLRGHAD